MAKKTTDDELKDLSQDWGGSGTLDGKPFSGEQIQEQVKNALKNVSVFWKGAIYYFENETKLGLWNNLSTDQLKEKSDLFTYCCPLEFDGVITSVSFSGDISILYNISDATSSDNVYLSIPAINTTQRGVLDKTGKDIPDDYTLVLERSVGSSGYTSSWDFSLKSGTAFSINLRWYMSAGLNTFRIKATNKEGDTTGYSNTVSVNRIDASLTRNSDYNWMTPYVGGQSYKVHGLKLSGASAKTIEYRWTKISPSAGEPSGWKSVSSSNNSDNFEYTPTQPTEGTGIYKLETRMSVGTKTGLTTLSWNVMYITSGDVESAILVNYIDAKTSCTNLDTASPIVRLAVYYMGQSDTIDAQLAIQVGLTESGTSTTTLRSVTPVNIKVKPNAAGGSTVNSINYSPYFDASATSWTFKYSFVKGTYTRDIATGTMTNSSTYSAVRSSNMFYFNPVVQSGFSTALAVNANNTSQRYNVTSSNLLFEEGIDGYIDDGIEYQTKDVETEEAITVTRQCFKIPAKAKYKIEGLMPMHTMSDSITFEFTFKTQYVADYTDDVISLYTKSSTSWRGIKIMGDRILIHTSADSNDNDDRDRDYTFLENETVHLIISYIKNYTGTGENTCIVFMNGAKVREFVLSDNFSSEYVDANLEFGSKSCDLFLYGFRIYYGKWFSSLDAQQNYVASQVSLYEKQKVYKRINSIYDGGQVSYNKCSEIGNVFYIELNNSSDHIPKFPDPIKTVESENIKKYEPKCKMGVKFKDIPVTWVKSGKVIGQGSSSAEYWIYNLKWTNTDNIPFEWAGPSQDKAYVLTAKKNFASGTHSHKMGFTKMYDELHKAIVGGNNHTAVLQYPFFGFQKVGDTYTFIGLYTMGPDKGDTSWFGYKDESGVKDFIRIEGSNFSRPGTAFRYIMDAKHMHDDISKTEDGIVEGAYTITPVGVTDSAKYEKQWEYSHKQNGTKKDLWERTYNMVKNCGQMVISRSTKPTGTSSQDLVKNTINDIVMTGVSPTNELFGKVYFFNKTTYEYEEDTTQNIFSQLTTADQRTSNKFKFLETFNKSTTTASERINIIKKSRRILFKLDYATVWNSDALFFELMFKLMNAISDNFAKNFYPATLGDKMDLIQDDVDTLGPINNTGKSGKPYYCEFGDTYGSSVSSADVYSGTESNLAQLINSTATEDDGCDGFDDKRSAMASKIFQYMSALSPTTAAAAGLYQRIMDYYDENLWKRAQDYFPASAYNADTEYTYEAAKKAIKNGQDNGKYTHDDILYSQITGPSKEAEKSWFQKRLLYWMSKYRVGDFSSSTSELGAITYQSIKDKFSKATLSYSLTLYPMYLYGEENTGFQQDFYKDRDGNPIKLAAGETMEKALQASSSIRVAIPAANYVKTFETNQFFTNDSVLGFGNAERLMKAIFGTGVTGISKLEFANCPSLEIVNANGVVNLSGVTFSNKCTRLSEINLQGTSVTTISVPSGSRVEKIYLPVGIQQITFDRVKNVQTFSVAANSSGVRYKSLQQLILTDCEGIPGIAIFKNSVNESLDRVALHKINEQYITNFEEAKAIADFLNGFTMPAKLYGFNVNGTETKSLNFITGTLTLKDSGGYIAGIKDSIRSKWGASLEINLV